MFIASYSNTMRNAKRFFPDEGLTIAPRYMPPPEIALPAPVSVLPQNDNKRKLRLPPADFDRVAWDIMRRRGAPDWVMEITREVAEKHEVNVLYLVDKTPGYGPARARYEVFYRIRSMVSPVNGKTPSQPMIGRWFGMDHTSVMWGVAKHAHNNGLPIIGELSFIELQQKKRERASARYLKHRASIARSTQHGERDQ